MSQRQVLAIVAAIIYTRGNVALVDATEQAKQLLEITRKSLEE